MVAEEAEAGQAVLSPPVSGELTAASSAPRRAMVFGTLLPVSLPVQGEAVSVCAHGGAAASSCS